MVFEHRSLLGGRLVILIALFGVIHAEAAPKPLKALLIAGGCCHDYVRQKDILKEGLEALANVEVDVIFSPDRSTRARFDIYENADWADGYDVIIHDECSADVKELPYVENILNAHRKVPAVNLHCAMHSYRVGTDAWFEFVGLQSTGHGPQEPIAVSYRGNEHSVTQPLADWTTIKEELYNNVKIFDSATPIAWGTQKVRRRNGEEREDKAVVAWVNEYGDSRVFSTTLGHNSETVADPRYLEFLSRGMLWACGKLEQDYFRDPATKLRRKNLAKGGKATASSEQLSENHPAGAALDGSIGTRWCANGPGENEWLQVDLGKPTDFTSVKIDWEFGDVAYRYRIEGSTDAQEWSVLVDASENERSGAIEHEVDAGGVRHLKVTYLGKPGGGWASIFEFGVFGGEMETVDANAERLEAERALLSDTKIPDGFEATIFAAPPMANYPVFVAAAPDGTLFVSSDGNGSLDRDANRGRVIRLRDLDGDGRADESKDFIANVDSPRGLVWDRDRLYLMHPPHLSAFIDHDGDGVSDEQKVLVSNIAFGFEDRPADHTSNGLSLGMDGWLYCAIGDFGFMDAVGADGRHLQLRGGGVVRVRPDGTGLELFASGTRNILEAPVSPLLDSFARDNTNDGGGWDVRFHHFTGLEEHGYPSLYKNFNDEIIQPLADYGGGSGCGAAWIDEPGIPAFWNNAPFTADWGRSRVYQHRISPSGATFTEVESEFFGATRVTDLDPDANSNIYIASWKGATFRWAGPDVGYIVRLKPDGYEPEPLADFSKAGAAGLIEMLGDKSYRRRLAAQRELLSRRLADGERVRLEWYAQAQQNPLEGRIGALFLLKLKWHEASHSFLAGLINDPSIASWAIRAVCEVEGERDSVPVDPIVAALGSADARTRREAVVGLARLGRVETGGAIVPLLGDADPVIAHTAVQSLKILRAADACFEAVDASGTASVVRKGALRVLQALHDPKVVDGLISRLEDETNDERRRGLIVALSRLHHTEGKWNGESWGTRPDTSGPYYSTVEWEETSRIAAALKQVFDRSEGAELPFIVSEFERHKIRMDGTLDVMVELAAKDESLIPSLVQQIMSSGELPPKAQPLIVSLVERGETSLSTRAEAAVALLKSKDITVVDTLLAFFADAGAADDRNARRALRPALSAFLSAPQLDQRHHMIEERAAAKGSDAVYADAALLKLSESKGASPEARESAVAALEAGWAEPERRVQILEAVRIAEHRAYKAKIVEASDDEDEAVARAARRVARSLRIDIDQEKADLAAGRMIAEMENDAVVEAVLDMEGDVELGERLFTQQICNACHTVSADEPQRGPFLGNIAATYNRSELAANILDPNRTIAQGFVSNLFELKDGTMHEGFVTLEAADKVTIRNIAAQEITIAVSDIVKREKLEHSLMPAGLVANLNLREFASMLAYLEAIEKE